MYLYYGKEGKKQMVIVQRGEIDRDLDDRKNIKEIIQALKKHDFDEVVLTAFEIAGEDISQINILKEIADLDTYTTICRCVVKNVTTRGDFTKVYITFEGISYCTLSYRNNESMPPTVGSQAVIGCKSGWIGFIAYEEPSFADNYIECELDLLAVPIAKYMKGYTGIKRGSHLLDKKYIKPFESEGILYRVIPKGGVRHINHRSFAINSKWGSMTPFKLVGNEGKDKLVHHLPYVPSILVYHEDTAKLRLYYCS